MTLGPFLIMPGKQFPARIIDGKLTPMLVSQQDFEECCCQDVPEYVRIWHLQFSRRSATINPDGSWSYGSECTDCSRSHTHGLGARYQASGVYGPGWYYDSRSDNPFGQSIFGYWSTRTNYYSSGSSSPPWRITSEYCYSHPGGTAIGGNANIRPNCLFYTVYSQEDEPMKWFTRWMIQGGNYSGSAYRPFSHLEAAGPVGIYDHMPVVNSTIPGFEQNGRYPANDVHWDWTDGSGVRRVGANFFYPPLVVAATF